MADEASRTRRARRLLRWYPREWRARYGEEFTAFLVDELDERPHSAARFVDVIASGTMARLAVAGLAGTALAPADRPRRALVTLGGALSCFLVVAVAIWAQLTVGWQWARPNTLQTEIAMVVMTLAIALLALVFLAAAAPLAWATGHALVRRDGRRLAAPSLMVIAGLGLVIVGTHHFANGWPGTGGHPWTHQGLVPGGVAASAWASTLFVTAYWLHPAALVHFPRPELLWMTASPVATVMAIVGAVKIAHRIEFSTGLVRYERRLGVASACAMALFFTGAALWVIDGGPGPRGLFHRGAIDMIELVVLSGSLVVAARAAAQASHGAGLPAHG